MQEARSKYGRRSPQRALQYGRSPLLDAQGHGLIVAKIASTVHDTFHALMLSELDQHGRTTPELFENINPWLGAFGHSSKCTGYN